MNKLGIVVGHNSASQGMTAYNGRKEYEFNLHVAKELNRLFAIPYYTRPSIMSYERQIDYVIEDLENDNITACIELHLNSATTKASGAEILGHYKYSIEEKDHATAFLADYCAMTGSRNRGLKNIHEEARGFYLMREAKEKQISAFILEPCFANWDNSESNYVLCRTDEYIQTLGNLCQKHFKFTS